MKKHTLLLIIMLVLSSLLFGQESSGKLSKFGFGSSFFNLSDLYVSDYDLTNSIYLTMDFGYSFRLEPVFNFIIDEGMEQYSFGLGVFGLKEKEKFKIIYGSRVAIGSNEIFELSPTIGGEYYFIENFSLGSEIQLRGLSSDGDWVFITNTSIIVRFYFK